MSNNFVITFAGYLLQIAGCIAIAALIVWRFFIPPSVSHLNVGAKIYNIVRKQQEEYALLTTITAILVILRIEKPILLNLQEVTTEYIPFLYIIAALLVAIAVFSFANYRKKEILIEVTENEIKPLTQVWGMAYSFGIFLLTISISFFSMAYDSADMNYLSSQVNEEAHTDTSFVTITLYTKPDNASSFDQIVIPKADLSTTYGTCHFYRLTVADTSGTLYEGFIWRGADELKNTEINIIRGRGYQDGCKHNSSQPNSEQEDENSLESLDFG